MQPHMTAGKAAGSSSKQGGIENYQQYLESMWMIVSYLRIFQGERTKKGKPEKI